MDNIIQVKDLGKQYRIGAQQAGYSTLRETIMSQLKAPFDRLLSLGKTAGTRKPFFWALKNITFNVQPGEITGIIGRNGSGKSTLLKILSGITEPTCGRAEIIGRLGCLLEVGTGFHPELTGRENIYLNGAILGMKRTEITRKFDAIVDFSGISKFIDTPVKFFSSGMYLRLAFSVAAHLETEILLIDEVLAVGDAQFQRQCLQKMSELASGGRTVMFVSHNLQAVTRLCKRGLVLEEGQIVLTGPIQESVQKYNEILLLNSGRDQENEGDGIHITGYRVDSAEPRIMPSQSIKCRFQMKISRQYWNVIVQLGIVSPDGANLVLETIDSGQYPELCGEGSIEVQVVLPPLWLQPLVYTSRIKVIASSGTGKTERFFSDWIYLNLMPQEGLEKYSEAVLSPQAAWSLSNPASTKQMTDKG